MMPSDSRDNGQRSKTLTVAVTEMEKAKVLHVAEMEDSTYAELLREDGINDIIAKYDRMVTHFGPPSESK